jgi:hypothetical protein
VLNTMGQVDEILLHDRWPMNDMPCCLCVGMYDTCLAVAGVVGRLMLYQGSLRCWKGTGLPAHRAVLPQTADS